MIKRVLVPAVIAAASLLSISAQAETLQSGRSTYLHSHYHAAHHYHMTYGHQRHHAYHGVGFGGDHRTTATGGNPGGYSSRN